MQATPEVEVEKAAELSEMRARKRMDEAKEMVETEREKLTTALEVAKGAAEEVEEAEKGVGLSASDALKAVEELSRLKVIAPLTAPLRFPLITPLIATDALLIAL